MPNWAFSIWVCESSAKPVPITSPGSAMPGRSSWNRVSAIEWSRTSSWISASRCWIAAASELTPQERQIALQVAEGRSNKEVAAALFLSTKTIEFHLSRVYRKLGLGSRTELARLAATARWPAEPARRRNRRFPAAEVAYPSRRIQPCSGRSSAAAGPQEPWA